MRRPTEETLNQIINVPGPATEKKLAEVLRYAVVRCDLRLLEWLAGVTGPSVSLLCGIQYVVLMLCDKASLLDRSALGFRDHDGYPLVSTCIIASTASVTAKEEKEQAVRIVVKRWPGIGQASALDSCERDSTESVKQGESSRHPLWSRLILLTKAPWTPLHLAALLSSPTLVSFLLTQGYSPYVTTPTGLTPLDLIADMPSRQDVVALLESMMDDPLPSPNSSANPQHLPVRSRDELLHLHRATKARLHASRTRRTKRREEQQARDAWVMDNLHASAMGEGSEFVCYSFEKERRRTAGAGTVDGDRESSEDSDTDSTGVPPTQESFPSRTIDLTDRQIPESTLLVFPPDTLPVKLSHLITNYPPQAYPLSRRTLPANSVYMMARYAVYRSVDARASLTGLLEMVMLEVERVCLVSRPRKLFSHFALIASTGKRRKLAASFFLAVQHDYPAASRAE